MDPRRLLCAIVICAAMTPAVSATDRFYPDSFATSPSGRYRIDAKSPDNAGPNPRPFASNFTYTLTDTSTRKVIWERKQPMTRAKGSSYASASEASPIQVFVNDEGVVAARTAWDTLLFLDPRDGHKRAEADVLKAFPQEQQDRFVAHSTAGPMWSQESDWFFLSLPGQSQRSCFVVRPYWNHRLIVDTSTGKHIDLGAHHEAASPDSLAGAGDEVRQLLTATIEEETRHALAALKAAPDGLKDDKDYHLYWQLRAALHTVVFLKLTQAEAPLRVLETGIDDKQDAYRGVRSKVRETLRAIGKTPAPGYGVRLYPLIDKGNYLSPDAEHPFNAQVSLQDRIANADKIAAGISTKQLTDLIGCPDARLFDGEHCYDYDIDAPSPYTLRVFLGQREATVAKVKKVTPFAFLHDPARMRGY